MAVAVFCLEQARQAMALAQDSSGEPNSWRGLDEFDRVEFYVLKLDHVHESCRILNRNWPSVFASPARNAANSFVQLWNGSTNEQRCEACAKNEPDEGATRQLQANCQDCKKTNRQCLSCQKPMCKAHSVYRFGELLRNAYSHYEEALATPDHRYRGEPFSGGRTVRDVSVPSWMKMLVATPGEGPDSVRLLSKEYRLDGVHEALVALERELAAVLTEPDDPWKVRTDA